MSLSSGTTARGAGASGAASNGSRETGGSEDSGGAVTTEPPALSAQTWPIGAAMMAFARDGGARAIGDGLGGSADHGIAGSTGDGAPDWCRDDLREVAMAGFDHIDLTDNWLSVGELDQRGLDRFAGYLADAGLAVSAISVTRRSVIDPDEALADENLARSLRAVEAAAALGAPIVCLGLHRPLLPAQLAAQWFWHEAGARDDTGAATRERAVRRFRRIAERAGELGVAISLEMYEETLLGTADGCVSLVQEIDLPNVGLNPDVANIVRLHRPVENWEDMLRVMLPYTNYWQVKNYLRDEDPATGTYFSAPAPLAYGYINYRRAIEMALEAGFSGPFCVEHYGGDALSVSAVNRDYVRRILASKLARSR